MLIVLFILGFAVAIIVAGLGLGWLFETAIKYAVGRGLNL